MTTDIGDLISDAMEDSSPSDVVGGAKKVPHPPKKMAVRVSGQTLLMDFDSDSDTENEVKKPCPPSSPGKVYLDDIFSDSDDDFCIVNTPTSTRVVSGVYMCGYGVVGGVYMCGYGVVGEVYMCGYGVVGEVYMCGYGVVGGVHICGYGVVGGGCTHVGME